MMKSLRLGRGDRPSSNSDDPPVRTKPGKGKKKKKSGASQEAPPDELLKDFGNRTTPVDVNANADDKADDNADDNAAPGVPLTQTGTGTTGESSYDVDVDATPSELSSSAYESSYNQYLTQIENDYGVQSFESLGPGAASSDPPEYPLPVDESVRTPSPSNEAAHGAANARIEMPPTDPRPSDARRISDRFSPSSTGSAGNVHAISYVTQAPEYGYGYGYEDDLSTLGDESIIRRARQNQQKQQELKDRQLRHQRQLRGDEAKPSGPGQNNHSRNQNRNHNHNHNHNRIHTPNDSKLAKTHTGSTHDMSTSPRSSDLSFSFTNIMNDLEHIPVSSRLGHDIDEESRKKQELEDMLDLVVGGGDDGDDGTDLSKDKESFVRRNKWKIIRLMIILGLFLLIAAAAILILSVLEMKKSDAFNSSSSDASTVKYNNDSNDNNNNNDDGMPPIFLPKAPSQPIPPTYMPPPDYDDNGNVFTVTLPPSSSPPVPAPVVFVEEVDDDAFTSLPVTEPPSATTTSDETETPTDSPSASPFSFTESPTLEMVDIVNVVSVDPNATDETADEFGAEQTKIGTDLKFILANRSPMSLPYIDDQESAQYKAFEWMTKDPEYWNMTIDTVVQRWTLAVLYYSTGGPNWKTDRFPYVYALGKQPWLSYSDECEWESSNEGSQGKICDDDKNYFAIHLRNVGLTGTLPAELGLLSEHMRLLFFNSNELTGTLPTELGLMTGLRKVNIQYNGIAGSIPSEIGNWGMLTIGAMGNNQLTGSIPSEMGMWTSVRTIGLENNWLEGTLPEELIGMVNIEKISLEKNFLSGTLPDTFNDMYQLTSLSIQGNDFTGEMPWGLCPKSFSMEELKADCEEIKCKCCTECLTDSPKTRTRPPIPAVTEPPILPRETEPPLVTTGAEKSVGGSSASRLPVSTNTTAPTGRFFSPFSP